MKKASIVLCFIAIALSIAVSIKRELSGASGLNSLVLLNGASVLLLAAVAFAVLTDCFKSVKRGEDGSQAFSESTKSLFTHMSCSIMLLNEQFTILDANEFMLKITGHRLEDIKGKKCYDVVGRGTICASCLVQKVWESGKAATGAILSADINGKQMYGKQTVIPVKGPDGNIEYVYEIIADVTQEIALEKENAETLLDIVTSMAHLIESRDPSTGTHCSNVQKIALAIGQEMALSERDMNELSIAAIIHDIGKIGIPEAVLNKPGKLTDAEFAIIKRHPEIGYEAVKHIRQLRLVSEAIRDHHEYFDGRGYPHGKKQAEISLIARILAVSDVFEALTANRVYRKAMSVKEAIGIIQAEKGRQFDPAVVEALVAVVRTEDDLAIKRRHFKLRHEVDFDHGDEDAREAVTRN